MQRRDGRVPEALRPVRLTPNFIPRADGSVLVDFGDTRVSCTASVEERQRPFLAGTNRGWVTAEYAMLPGATRPRSVRESTAGKVGGRSQEIQRLVGRSLRMAVDLDQLGPITVHVDCDVLQADGGTRTAAITGAWVALGLALKRHFAARGEPAPALRPVAAISVGLVDGRPLLDLDYEEDARAEVDMNVVMDGDGRLVEIQGTAEQAPFDRAALSALLDLAEAGIRALFIAQAEALDA